MSAVRGALALVLVLASMCPAHAGQITFGFNFAPSFDTAAGANAEALKSHFTFVGNYMSSVLATTGTFNTTMTFEINGENNPTAGYAAFGVPNFDAWEVNTFNKAPAQVLAEGGENPNGVNATVGFNTYELSFLGDPELDVNSPIFQNTFRHIVLHELTHALGFAGFLHVPEATSVGLLSWMDQYFYGFDGTSYVPVVQNVEGTLTLMANAEAAFTDAANPLLFRGPNVLEYLGNATGQAMYTPATFTPGSSIYHYFTADDPPGLMHYTFDPENLPAFGYSGLDQAFMKDLGFAIVPEPSGYVLAGLGAAGVFALLRSKRQRLVSATAA